MGLMQVRWVADGTTNPGTEPLRWKSTAFNLDLYAAVVRYFYDGLCDWGLAGYSAGDEWRSIGAWKSPIPWNDNADAQQYIAAVQQALASRPWEDPGFPN